MSADLNIEMVTEFVEQKLQNKPVDKILGKPRRSGRSISKRSQNIAMWRETRPSGNHRQQGQIPVNNSNNQQCGKIGKTRRHRP